MIIPLKSLNLRRLIKIEKPTTESSVRWSRLLHVEILAANEMRILYVSRSHVESDGAGVRGICFGLFLDHYVLSHSFLAAAVPTYAQIKGRGRRKRTKKEKTFVPLRFWRNPRWNQCDYAAFWSPSWYPPSEFYLN